MSELSDSQLLLLDNLIYLQGVADSNGRTVGTIVKRLINNNLYKSRNPDKSGTEDEYPCKMTREEWMAILKAIERDPQLNALEITKGQTGVLYDKQGQLIRDSNGKVLEAGMRVATFVDPNNKSLNPIVVFRGTGGDYEWFDNGQGGYLSETTQQKAALDYVKSLKYDKITVTGHSKGGNKTQFVTIMSDKVVRGVSFDGQGFSKEFLEKYKDLIEANAHKITSISAKDDFVNCLLNPIAGTIKYIDTDKQSKFKYNHKPNIVFDENGQLREETERGRLSKYINEFTIHINKTMKEPFRSYAIDGVLSFLQEGGEGFNKPGEFQKYTAAVLLISHLDDYMFAQISEKFGDEAELAVSLILMPLFPYIFVDDFWHALLKNGKNAVQFITDIVISLGDRIVSGWAAAVEGVKRFGNEIRETANRVVRDVQAGWERLRQGTIQIMNDIKDMGEKVVQDARRWIDSAVQNITSFFQRVAAWTKNYMQTLKDSWNKAVDSTKKTISNVIKQVKGEVSKRYNAFKDGMTRMAKLTRAAVKDVGKRASFTINGIIRKVTRGVAARSGALLLVDIDRLVELQMKLVSLESYFQSRTREIINDAQRITSGVSRMYHESNVQSQIQRVEKSCDDVKVRASRVSEELQRKIKSLKYTQDQYRVIELMIVNGVRAGTL